MMPISLMGSRKSPGSQKSPGWELWKKALCFLPSLWA